MLLLVPENGAPTHGTCEAADFVHVRTGHYGEIRLDGLNAVTIGNLVESPKMFKLMKGRVTGEV